MIKGYGGIPKSWESKIRKLKVSKKKKPKSTVFTTMSVAHADDADDHGEPYHTERILTCGDFYTGLWFDKLPQGNGKYLWIDGCMYVGEWSKGKITGKGRFSWPSGATYEGDFKNGFMDGKGTYTGTSGDTYRGDWVMNLKTGQGTKHYSNGDYYDGDWHKGFQNGHGRYQWRNGNDYIGSWKNGMMNGNGTLIWSNGNRYDGFWEDGFPKGNGTFRWLDGSFYVGVWSKDGKEQNGTYYPSDPTQSTNLDWDPQTLFSVDLLNCKACPDERITVLPSQKMPNWSEDGRASSRTSNYSWESDSSAELRNGDEGLSSHEGLSSLSLDDASSNRTDGFQLNMQPPKKQGVTIKKGHKNYDLMLNLQLGIRHSVGRPAPATSLDLKASYFDPKEKVWTKFPPEGSKHTPPHQSTDFRWKDYCPVVFRTLRKLFSVDPADYMLSICGNDALRELSSPGKSGSFFYLTNDDRYMIKTMKKAEVKVLIRMLPAYYNHVRSFEDTLVTKFFGLHCVKLTGAAQKKVRFVIMGNLFCSEYAIQRRFDLKGSSHGRTTAKPPEAEIDPNTTLKDLDLNFIFRLRNIWYQEFCRQVDRDCDFLEQERIMDYSLLVGLHFRQAPESSNSDNGNLSDSGSQKSFRLGIGMPARVERTVRKSDCEAQLIGEPTGELYEVILFFGIIDILQDYDISKKLEHAYKSMQYDPTSISAVDPRQYSKRFRDFVLKVFVDDT